MQKAEAQTLAAGDIEAGKKVYARCRACHSLEPGKNGLGSSFANLIGRKAGTVEGFAYSPALTQSDITWTPEALDMFLQDVKGFVPGNKMGSLYPAGVPKEKDRQDLIAYLVSITE